MIKGSRHTPEAREKIRLAHLGRKLSDITKEKISKANRGRNLYTLEQRQQADERLRQRLEQSEW